MGVDSCFYLFGPGYGRGCRSLAVLIWLVFFLAAFAGWGCLVCPTWVSEEACLFLIWDGDYLGGGSFSSFYLGVLGVRSGWMGVAVMLSGVRGCEAKQAAWAEKLGKAGRRKETNV